MVLESEFQVNANARQQPSKLINKEEDMTDSQSLTSTWVRTSALPIKFGRLWWKHWWCPEDRSTFKTYIEANDHYMRVHYPADKARMKKP